MPLQLNNPKTVNTTIAEREITAFTMDEQRGEIHVDYMEKDANGLVLSEHVLTISDTRTVEVLTAVETYSAGGDTVRDSIKKALYDEIAARTGDAGTVV